MISFSVAGVKTVWLLARRTLVSITADLQVTTRVKKKLRLQALNEVEGSVREYLIVPAWLSVGVVIWITWSLIFPWLGLNDLHALWRIGICGIVAGFYILLVVKFHDWCEEPRGEWQQARLFELATLRQQQIHEAKRNCFTLVRNGGVYSEYSSFRKKARIVICVTKLS